MNIIYSYFYNNKYLCFDYDNFKSFLDTLICQERSFIIRPLVNCIPAWIRFAQCLRRYRDTKEAFPHLVNAGKYSSTFFTVLFATLRAYYQGNSYIQHNVSKIFMWESLADSYADPADNPYLYLWITASIVSSCYAYTWDIKMDWGLFDKAAGENKFLRDEIVYSSTVNLLNVLVFRVVLLYIEPQSESIRSYLKKYLIIINSYRLSQTFYSRLSSNT